MRDPTRTKRTPGAALVGALGSALLFSAVARAGEPTAQPQGAMCPAGASVDLNAEATALVRQVMEEELQRGQNSADVVVLNNRGYNYGPPPSIRFDPLLLEQAQQGSRSR